MGSPAGRNNFTKVYADEFGRINSTDPDANAKQMVAEIGGRGPIECSICVTKGECTQMNPQKYSRANPLCIRRFAPVELSLSHSPRPLRHAVLSFRAIQWRHLPRHDRLHHSRPLDQHRWLRPRSSLGQGLLDRPQQLGHVLGRRGLVPARQGLQQPRRRDRVHVDDAQALIPSGWGSGSGECGCGRRCKGSRL